MVISVMPGILRSLWKAPGKAARCPQTVHTALASEGKLAVHNPRVKLLYAKHNLTNPSGFLGVDFLASSFWRRYFEAVSNSRGTAYQLQTSIPALKKTVNTMYIY